MITITESLEKLISCLEWYVSEDETFEGGEWDVDNAYWIAGKRNAEQSIEEAKAVLARMKEIADTPIIVMNASDTCDIA